MRLGANARDCEHPSGVQSYETLYVRGPAMRMKHTALLLTAGFLLMPTLLWSQLPGIGGGPGGSPAGGDRPRSGMSGMMSQLDPDMLFNMIAGGKDVIQVDQLDPRAKGMIDRFGASMGLTGNTISRDQFKQAMNKAKEMAASGQLPSGMNFRGGMGGDGDRRMDDRYQRMDRNQDGVLSNDELSETLQGERDKYDANHDGVIDLGEYRNYVNARIGDSRPDGAGGPQARPDGAAPGDDEERSARPSCGPATCPATSRTPRSTPTRTARLVSTSGSKRVAASASSCRWT